MPDDLRTPTFACAFCRGELRTADYAGVAAVSADALLGHVRAAVALPTADAAIEASRSAPRFQETSTATRAAQCLKCAGPVEVPLDLYQNQFTCPGCHAVQAVNDYVSDKERLELDMARQVAGNEAYRRLLAEGVACGRCGGANAVPDDGSVQLTCSFCGAAVLLSDHVDAGAVARHRLKHGVFAMRDEALRANAAHTRKVNTVVAVVVALVVVGVVVVNLVARH
ncbi:MAG: hypothetical protein Q7V43_23280 [Myxococcales bacterium]|nr:hypothetical protein [Myxococcales bacterium]